MTVAIAADHAGYELKESVTAALRKEGIDIVDLGVHDTTPVDYPDLAREVAGAVLNGKAERGILVCGSGVGAGIAANKIRGIRAGVCHDTYSGHQGVEHDNMNILCLGARVIGPALALEVSRAFLQAKFSGEERHVRRVNKILAIEQQVR
jgi:ribose 5-phosphate isomerase B